MYIYIYIYIFMCVPLLFLRTHHYLEVVAGDDLLAILHPADAWQWVSSHSTLQLDVSGLVSVRVGRVVQELRRHCRKKHAREFKH